MWEVREQNRNQADLEPKMPGLKSRVRLPTSVSSASHSIIWDVITSPEGLL